MKPPIILYDNKCNLCSFFVRIVNVFSFRKLRIVGHYTDYGKQINSQIPHPNPTIMFWLIKENDIYGGRAALLALIHVLFQRKYEQCENSIPKNSCDSDCDVFFRSYSVFKNSAHFNISLQFF